MEEIIKNPGFQHITEKIFLALCIRDLLACQLLNKNSKIILDNNPIFWIKKWISSGLSKNNQTGWIKAIQLTKHNTKCSSSKKITLLRILNAMDFTKPFLPFFLVSGNLTVWPI